MAVALLFAAFMVPAALIWSIAFPLFRRSRPKRLALVLVSYFAVGLATGSLSILLLPVSLPGTIIALGLFEWTLARERA